jgi:TRAP-type C4-dicarboxylate transport system substrate-binding protein
MHGMGSRGRIVAAAALLVITAVSSAAANDRSGLPTAGTRVLRTATVFDEDVTLPFFDAVRDGSGGSVTLDVSPNFEPGVPTGEADLIAAVKAGTVDVGLVGSRALHDAGVTAFDALQAPFLIDSYDRQAAVLRSPVIDEMASQIAGSGLAVVGVLPGSLFYLFSIEKPIVEPGDFAGTTVMAPRSPITRQVYETIGATVVDQNTPEAADHDAAELPLGAVLGNAADARYLLANVPFEPRPIVVVMSEAGLAALDETQRAALQDAASRSIDETIRRSTAEDAENLANGCRRNLTLLNATDDQRAALAAAVQPVLDGIDQSGPWLGEIRALLGNEAAAESVTCQSLASTAPPSQGDTPIDGTWRACPTVQDILAAGGDPGEAAGNDGCYTMDLHGGLFKEGGSAAADTLAGHYSVDGNLVTFDRNNGERFVFTWTLLGDRLSFGHGPAGSISPAPVRALPFERVGD